MEKKAGKFKKILRILEAMEELIQHIFRQIVLIQHILSLGKNDSNMYSWAQISALEQSQSNKQW